MGPPVSICQEAAASGDSILTTPLYSHILMLDYSGVVRMESPVSISRDASGEHVGTEVLQVSMWEQRGY